MELRALELTVHDDLTQVLRGAQHICVGEVERSEAEAHDVGLAEVADDVPGDQRLHHRICLRMPQAHLRAAPPVLAWGGHLEVREEGVEALDEEAGEGERPLADRGD